MPRRKRVGLIRDIGADPRFNSFLVQKLINMIMIKGKKNLARAIVYEAFDILLVKAEKDEKKGFQIFEKAIDQIKPSVEVRSRRVGGGVYQIPAEVRPRRAMALAIRWLINSAAVRADKTMGQRLASEIFEASQGRGNAIKKRADVHRMAEANRAFSHYAW
ncbi:30S ribosomal protein S7 [Candidatus Babeliales bacterium]|nr:30S ribosomal protein S7 [Candidatus Babeliales bacterium]